MESKILYSIYITEKITEPDVIEKFIVYRFLEFIEAFKYAKKYIKIDNVLKIEMSKIDGEHVIHLLTLIKNKNEK